MWLVFALASALLSGTTAVLAKYGIQKVDSSLAVALRSVVMLAFAWMILLLFGGWTELVRADPQALLFPLCSGATNSLAWISYFKALRIGSVSQVASIDKAGLTLTILGGWLLLGESMTAAKWISVALILIGALLSADGESNPQSKSEEQSSNVYYCSQARQSPSKSWIFWAVLSAVSASATTLLSKAGVASVSSDLSFAIRTGVMFVIAWATVITKRELNQVRQISRKAMCFLGLSGLTTALAWLCYFKALASPDAQAGIVQPIDKLSILVSAAGAKWLLNERIKPKAVLGLALLTGGIVILLF